MAPRPQAASLMTNLQLFGQRATMTSAGSEFMKAMVEQLNAGLKTTTGIGSATAVEVSPVACEHVSVQRITYKNKSVLIGFAEDYLPPADKPQLPVVYHLTELSQLMNQQGHQVIYTLVIRPEDYVNALKYANHLTPILKIAAEPENFKLNLASLSGLNYEVRTDLAYVRSVIDAYNPSTVRPPVDVGIVIRAKGKEQGAKPHDLIAIGATTRFVAKSQDGTCTNTGKDFIPFVSITSIVTPTPSVSMALFGISVAADYLLPRENWLAQFRNFAASENVGNLIVDTNGEPFKVKDPAVLHEMKSTRLEAPVLTVDILDGSPRVPGLESIVSNHAKSEVADFMGINVEQLTEPVSTQTHIQFSGADAAGEDTRKHTYLYFMSQKPEGYRDYLKLLVRNTDPAFSLRAIEEIMGVGTTKPLYINASVLLNGNFLNVIARAMTQALSITWEADKGVINNLSGTPVTGSGYSSTPLYGQPMANQSWGIPGWCQ